MKLRRLILLHSLALAVTLSCRATARADESVITIYPAGSGSFSVKGNLLDKVATLEISVDYDASTLINPTASCGPLAANAHCEINSANSGVVQIRISSTKSPLSGMGILASLNFTRLGDDPGAINSLDARLTDSNGASLPAVVNVVNPAPDQYGRKVPKPRKEVEPDSKLAAQPQNGGVAQMETSAPLATEDMGSKEMRPVANALPYHRLEGVLERFHGRPDSTPLESLLLLFEGVPGSEVRQDPPIVLSDGRSTALLTVELAGNGNKAPSFALNGMHCISLQKGDGNNWAMEVLPDKGVYAASLTVLSGAALTEYPLTVSPQLEAAGRKLGPDDFARWRQCRTRPNTVAEKGARPGYVEDYIYAANYLAKKLASAPSAMHP